MKKKLWLSLILCVALLVSMSSYALAAGFSDLTGHWAESQISQWADKGLTGGYADGTFKPNKEVTRAEFVALVNRAFAIPAGGTTSGFSDVKAEQWYFGEVVNAKAASYIGGYSDGTFRPNQTISRQEVASILVRLLKLQPTSEGTSQFADAARIQDWSRNSIGAVVKSGFMKGFPDNTFQPLKSITRAEAVVALDRALSGSGVIPVGSNGIEGTVTFNGKSVNNAVVQVFEANSFKVFKEAKTTGNGFFKFDLNAGTYDIIVATENEIAYQSDVKVGGGKLTTVSLPMEKAAVVSGILKDKDGNVVKKTTIAFTTNPTFVTTTDNDGKYSLAVLANHTYIVRAYNPDKKDQEPDLVTESLAVGAAGKHDVGTLKTHFAVSKSSGGGGGGGTPPADTVIIEKEIPLGDSVSLGVVDKPTKVKAEVKLPSGKSIAMEIDIPATGTACSLKVEELADNIPAPPADDPETPFVGLNITLEGAPGKEVTIALPLPTGLNNETVAAYHYNTVTGMWDYREASVVDHKVVFKTTLSPVAVSKKVAAPRELSAYNVTNQSVGLEWDSVDNATKYMIYRDKNKIGETAVTSYTDTNLAAGFKYTYTVVACNKFKFTSKESPSKTITTSAIAIPGNNLLEILDAVEGALAQISPEDWEKLKENRDRLLGYTDDQIIEALKNTGLEKAFESVINSTVTDQQARVTIAIIRSVAYLGEDTGYDNRTKVIEQVKELKTTYSEQISKLVAKGVTQKAVYDYLVDMYDEILTGEYVINNDSYESDLYNAALEELRNGRHASLKTVAKDAFDRIKSDYSTVNEGDSDFKKLLKELIAEQEFDTITGSKVRLMKEYLVSEVQGDEGKYATIVDLMDLIINTSKVFVPTQS